jgi:hypothetical protein
VITEAILNTIIGTLGTVLVAYLGYLGIRATITRRRNSEPDEASEEQDAALLKYENNPGVFVKDVLADNRAKNEELAAMREDMKAFRADIKALRDDLDTTRRNERTFRDALGRWMVDILAAWGIAPDMPKPRESDRETLQAIIPNNL